MPSDQFLYDRKLPGTDEPRVIRLLDILPGRRSDPIICKLRYVSPEYPPYYEAISYCWEGQEPSVIIDCNDQPLRITENLSAAVTALRREDSSLLMWADGICIDQASVEEKNSQVPLMRLIFQNAALVQVWLGEDTPDRKDKVYALIGLSTIVESQVQGLVPDYSLSTAQVFTDVSKTIISESLTLDILGVPRTAPNPLVGNVPSWVTDWSGFHLASSLSFKDLQENYIFDYNATKVHVPKQVAFRGASLILNGHVFDAIVKVGQVMSLFPPSTIDDQPTSEPPSSTPGGILRMLYILAVLQDWRALSKGSSSNFSYPGTSDSILEVFCRTIFLNHLPEGYTLASAVHDYGNLFIRVASFVMSLFSRHPAILKFLNWYESRSRFIYALLVAQRDTKASFLPEMIARTVGRRMVVTKCGYLGLAPELAETGHCVAIVKGAKVPLILRPMEDAKWELIGDCYIHGIMYGEGFEEQKCANIEIV